jgi:hypothetical protein
VSGWARDYLCGAALADFGRAILGVLDIDARFLAIFGAELRTLRIDRRLSIQQLAERLRRPAAMLEAIEAGHQIPPAPIVRGCEHLFGNPGTLARISLVVPVTTAMARSRVREPAIRAH